MKYTSVCNAVSEAVTVSGMNLFGEFSFFGNKVIPRTKYVIPGEELHAEILDGSFQKFNKFIKKSQHRCSPHCHLYTFCSGCDLQHVNYGEQISIKERLLRSILKRHKLLSTTLLPSIPSPILFNYRSKVQYAINANALLPPSNFNDQITNHQLSSDYFQDIISQNNGFFIGYSLKGFRNQTVPVSNCHLIPNIGNIIYPYIVKSLVGLFPNKSDISQNLTMLTMKFGSLDLSRDEKMKVMINFDTKFLKLQQMEKFPEIFFSLLPSQYHKQIQTISIIPDAFEERVRRTLECQRDPNFPLKARDFDQSGYLKILYGDDHFLYDNIHNMIFKSSLLSYNQPNLYQIENFIHYIKDILDININDVIYDLFCGSGLIGLSISKYAKQVIGFDILKSNIDVAHENMKINNINNAGFFQQDLLKLSNFSKFQIPRPDIVIIDPNRPGLTTKIIQFIVDLSPRQICYVSCKPSTFFENVEGFLSKYQLKEIRLLDMLPNTSKFELISLFERIK